MKLTLYVALLWALWHLPDHFADEGWGVEQLIAAPVETGVDDRHQQHAAARPVVQEHQQDAGEEQRDEPNREDASISQMSYDVVPASNTARFLIFSGMIVALATAVIIATKGQLGRRGVDAAR